MAYAIMMCTDVQSHEIDREATEGDAIFLARIYAEEHAKRLDVPMINTLRGGKFVTNNSKVTYEAWRVS